MTGPERLSCVHEMGPGCEEAPGRSQVSRKQRWSTLPRAGGELPSLQLSFPGSRSSGFPYGVPPAISLCGLHCFCSVTLGPLKVQIAKGGLGEERRAILRDLFTP